MGRTLLPFSQMLSERRNELSQFRRAMRVEDQQAFDAIFKQARLHIQAAAYYSNPDPAEDFFLSVLVETWKQLDSLQTRLNELEKKVNSRGSKKGNTAA